MTPAFAGAGLGIGRWEVPAFAGSSDKLGVRDDVVGWGDGAQEEDCWEVAAEVSFRSGADGECDAFGGDGGGGSNHPVRASQARFRFRRRLASGAGVGAGPGQSGGAARP